MPELPPPVPIPVGGVIDPPVAAPVRILVVVPPVPPVPDAVPPELHAARLAAAKAKGAIHLAQRRGLGVGMKISLVAKAMGDKASRRRVRGNSGARSAGRRSVDLIENIRPRPPSLDTKRKPRLK